LEELANAGRRTNLFMMFAAFFGMILNVVAAEVCFDFKYLRYQVDLGEKCPAGDALDYISLFSLVVLLASLCKYYHIRAKIKMTEYDLESPWQAFMTSNITSMRVGLLCEFVVLFFQPMPMVKGGQVHTFGFGPNQVVWVTLRWYLFWRVIYDYFSPYRREELRGLPRQPGDAMNWIYSIKLLIYKNAVLCLCFVLPVIVAFGAYGIYILERPYFVSTIAGVSPIFGPDLAAYVLPDPIKYQASPFGSYGNCCWFALVTLTTVLSLKFLLLFHSCYLLMHLLGWVMRTFCVCMCVCVYGTYNQHLALLLPFFPFHSAFLQVGYGDMVPVGGVSRIVASLVAFMGITCTSILVGSVSVMLMPTPFQAEVIAYIESKTVREELKIRAIALIQAVWRRHSNLKVRRASVAHAPAMTQSPPSSLGDVTEITRRQASPSISISVGLITPIIQNLIQGFSMARKVISTKQFESRPERKVLSAVSRVKSQLCRTQQAIITDLAQLRSLVRDAVPTSRDSDTSASAASVATTVAAAATVTPSAPPTLAALAADVQDIKTTLAQVLALLQQPR
jgi:hypothetical protein